MTIQLLTGPNDTVEICIQGGISVVNGVKGIFKVYPVQMVTKKSRLKRENGKGGHQRRKPSRSASFNELLESINEVSAPDECYTVTYTADRQLQTYSYRVTREYTF